MKVKNNSSTFQKLQNTKKLPQVPFHQKVSVNVEE